jgi:hypothetical protein
MVTNPDPVRFARCFHCGLDAALCQGLCFNRPGPAPADAVHSPAHYARWKMQPIEFLMINDVPGWLFNVVKYCFRYDAKDGLQDLRKARNYLDMKIRELEGVERFWETPSVE